MRTKLIYRCSVCGAAGPVEWDPRTAELFCRDCAEAHCRRRFEALAYDDRMELMGMEQLTFSNEQ